MARLRVGQTECVAGRTEEFEWSAYEGDGKTPVAFASDDLVRFKLAAKQDGVPVLDTTDAVLVWEPRRVVPMYAVPVADVLASLAPCAAPEVPDRLPPVLGPVHFGWHHTPGRSFDLVVGGQWELIHLGRAGGSGCQQCHYWRH